MSSPFGADPDVKHRFAFMSTGCVCVIVHIDVNSSQQVRINGGKWHGHAVHGNDGDHCCWELLWHWNADVNNMKRQRYYQIPETFTYMHTAVSTDYTVLLITKVC